jgi:hypothetical protein
MEPSWPTSDAPCPYCGNLVWLRSPKRSRVTRVMASVPSLPATLVASLIALGLICANWWLLESWQERAFVNIVVLSLIGTVLFGRWIGNIGRPHATYLLGRWIGRGLNLLVHLDQLAFYHSPNPMPLTTTAAAKGAVKSGFIGLGLSALGLAGIGSVGVFGSMRGTGIWAVPIHFGSILLMFSAALLLGIGIQHLRLSFVGLYSLIVGRPVYGFDVMVDTRKKV